MWCLLYSQMESSKIPFPICRHVKGIVLVALADGTLAIFHRGVGESLWIYNMCADLLLCKSIFKQIDLFYFKEIFHRRKNKGLNWILTMYDMSKYVSAWLEAYTNHIPQWKFVYHTEQIVVMVLLNNVQWKHLFVF